MGVMYDCGNAHLLRHRFEHTHASVINYQLDSLMKATYCKARNAISLKPKPKILGARGLIKSSKTMDISVYTRKQTISIILCHIKINQLINLHTYY